MAWLRITFLAAVGALVAAASATAASITDGGPRLADYRGTPVAVVFFHPL